ncbi:MAG: glycosyl hydrolase family 8 [Flavobacteriales bacterium]
MKNNFLKVSTLFLASLFAGNSLCAQINTPAGATKPFNSNASYQYGIMPTNLPAGGTYTKSSDAATAYNSWKSRFVVDCSAQGSKRVLFDDNSSTVSEGIAYGLLLSAYAADKTTFDGLWKYYKDNMNSHGVMNWKMSGCTGTSGANGATDAELDAAMALLIAEEQWPTSTSPYDYKAEATTLIGKIRVWEIHPSTYQTINGDAWGFSNNCRNPSYFAPAYYREYAKVETSQATFWNNTVTATNSYLLTNRNSTTGLVSNWSDQNAAPNTCNGPNEYGWDACRNPWRMATDVLWNGSTATTASDICAKIAAWSNGNAGNLKGPLAQNAANPSAGQYKAGAFSTYAAAVMGSSSTYQSHLNSCYTAVVALGNSESYFNSTLRALTLFTLTGNFWKPGSAGASNVAPTVSLTAPTDNSSVCEGTAVTISATAADTDGSISKVEFYYGSTLINSDNTAPYSYSWTTASAGVHTLTAIAYDDQNKTTTSSSRKLTVNAAPSAPTATSPVNYVVGAAASQLSATGTALKWYTVANGGSGSGTAPIPSTSGVGTTTYYVSQTTNGCESARKAIVVNVVDAMLVRQVASTLTMDGSVDPLWSGAITKDISKVIIPTVDNASDLSGTFRTLWDAQNFYVLAEITDNVKTNDGPAAYQDDAIELFFDFNNDKATTYGANDVQFTFRWSDNVVSANPGSKSVSGIVFSMAATATGYVFEAKIPWANIPGSASVGQLHGFDIHVNDDDDGGNRDGKMSWASSSDDAWQNPSYFGTIQLSDQTTGAEENFVSVAVYPNPFTSSIFVSGLNGVTDFMLTDISGRVVLSGKTDGAIEIQSDLSAGIYNLILKKEGGYNAVAKVVRMD